MAPPLVWSDSFNVGNQDLDDQHRHLVELINDFCSNADATPQELITRLHVLGNAAREHMHDEDSILREIDASIRKPSAKGRSKRFLKAVTDAALTAHIAEHANLMREFDALAKKLQIARSIPHSELCADIKAWFLDHAIKHDAHIKTIFQSM